MRLDGRRLVAAPHGSVERDVALDGARAERDRGYARLQPDLVPRVPDRARTIPPQESG